MGKVELRVVFWIFIPPRMWYSATIKQRVLLSQKFASVLRDCER